MPAVAYAWSTNSQIQLKQQKNYGIAQQRDYTSVNSYNFLNKPFENNKRDLFPRELSLYMDICFETDNGMDYYNQGTAYFLPHPTTHCQNEIMGVLEQCRMLPIVNCLYYISKECMPRAEADYCLSSIVLIEKYCSKGRISTVKHMCEYSCYNGACL